jgi:hypothetical protein
MGRVVVSRQHDIWERTSAIVKPFVCTKLLAVQTVGPFILAKAPRLPVFEVVRGRLA